MQPHRGTELAITPNAPVTAADLRQRAEAALGDSGRGPPTAQPPAPGSVAGGPALLDPTVEAQRLLHELQVHQVELELQNEALRQAQSQLEQSQAHYVDLYESAPVGYCTLDAQGRITQANRYAAGLLHTGLSRTGLSQPGPSRADPFRAGPPQTHPADLLDLPLGHCIVPEDRAAYEGLLQRVATATQPQT